MTRQTINLMHDWFFCPRHQPAHRERDCDLAPFEPVTLPHSNVRLPAGGFDDQRYQGICTYRRTFRLPPGSQGKRVFADIDGAMAEAQVYVNGQWAGEHQGGYTAFSLELTHLLEPAQENTLVLVLDSTEQPGIPPFGGRIDYMTFGGLYRSVRLRVVEPMYLGRVWVKPAGIIDQTPRLEIETELHNGTATACVAYLNLQIADLNGAVLYASSHKVALPAGEAQHHAWRLDNPTRLALWTLTHPALYAVQATLIVDGTVVDVLQDRFGWREGRFTPQGFNLNGELIKLRGLNRHQSYPWVGYAMPPRVQARDAEILKRELHCNMVRTSHYPQAPEFLDRCDELGLLVLEEIPGWQHMGDAAWQAVACRHVREMIERDFNHPSIVLWGVRINESADDDVFYTKTNAIAHELDPTRQTGGVRCKFDSHLLEDVFTYNDFDTQQLKIPNHPLYLITEYGGHMCPTKPIDNVDRITEHTRLHAHVMSQVGQSPQIAGALGWCAFDYNTHGDFGSGDRICHHGVCDMFRIPKDAAGVYAAQCDPDEEIVLWPAFGWMIGDRSESRGVGPALINSNCETLRIYLGDELVATLRPARDQFPGLAHPPFILAQGVEAVWGARWQELKIAGLIGSEVVATRTLSNRGVDDHFTLQADDTQLVGDGIDATRVWFMVVDAYGNRQRFSRGCLTFAIDGPGELIGDNPFALYGGAGAVWLRALAPGQITLTASHAELGTQSVQIEARPA